MLAAEDAPSFASGRDLSLDELRRRADAVRSDANLAARLVAAYEGARERVAALHVEQQIYEGFVPKADESLLENFHTASWADRLSIVRQLQDRRMFQLGRRLLFTERPDLLAEQLRYQLERMQAERLLGGDGQQPWRTLSEALFELEGKLSETHPTDDLAFLAEHREHLRALQIRAKERLGLR
jgi:exodeoxyribonuclease I